MFVRYSEIIRRVIVKNLQNVCLGQLSSLKPGMTKKIVGLWFAGEIRTQADKKYVCSKFPIFDPSLPLPHFFDPVCFKGTPYPQRTFA